MDDQDEPRDEKDDLIQRLSNENKQLESNFKQVKKRNKQLLVMLQQGESKCAHILTSNSSPVESGLHDIFSWWSRSRRNFVTPIWS